MTKHFVRVLCDINCEWEGLPPVYRVYVNDELFTERTWIWTDGLYLEEAFQIEAEPGEYTIRHEPLPPNLAKFRVDNFRIAYGPAEVNEQGQVRIHNATV